MSWQTITFLPQNSTFHITIHRQRFNNRHHKWANSTHVVTQSCSVGENGSSPHISPVHLQGQNNPEAFMWVFLGYIPVPDQINWSSVWDLYPSWMPQTGLLLSMFILPMVLQSTILNQRNCCLSLWTRKVLLQLRTQQSRSCTRSIHG